MKKIKLIYYNKSKISNLIIKNNSSLLTGVLQKNNIIYQFKCPLGDGISENNICWFNLDYPIEKTYNAPVWHKFHNTEFKKTLMPNNRITENSYWKHNNIRSKSQAKTRFSRHYILRTYNPNLIELILKPVLMYLNVFSYWCYL